VRLGLKKSASGVDLYAGGDTISGVGGGGGGEFSPTGAVSTKQPSGTPEMIGQFAWIVAEHGSGGIYFEAVLSAETGATATLVLHNVTDNAQVTTLTHNTTTPTAKTSANLVGNPNFSTVADKVYEVRLYSSDSTKAVTCGGWWMREA